MKIQDILDLPKKLLFLTITYSVILATLTIYKGVVWGVMAPTVGISTLFGVDVIWKRRIDWFKVACCMGAVFTSILLGVYYYMEPEPTTQDNFQRPLDPLLIKPKFDLKDVALESEGAKLVQWPSALSVADVYFLGIYMPWFIVPSDHTLMLKPRKECSAKKEWECCFQFMGSEGVVIIDLGKNQPAQMISIADTIYHPPNDFSLFGSVDSIIGSFSWFSLGNFTRDCSSIGTGKPQNFMLESAPRTLRYLKLDVKNNCAGDVHYTTLCTISVYVLERDEL